MDYMSLLWSEYEPEFQDLVDDAFRYECTRYPDYYARLSPRVERIIYRDTRYNADFLYTAWQLRDEKVLSEYARWLYKLMASILRERQTPSETADYTADNFTAIRHAVQLLPEGEKRDTLLHLVDCAVESVRAAAAHYDPEPDLRPCRYEQQVTQYLDSLLHKNTRQALYLVQSWLDGGIPLTDVYVEILAESMRRVGELWHTARITVDTEHYCTSVTQTAMAQMYPTLFETARCGRTILCACPGTELHEMGARMVADLFENDGWDSVFLGAAVPEDAMLDAVRENKPDLIALSVTMPQHLMACHRLIEAIRKEFPSARIAVGGKAFQSTNEIWRSWQVDLYSTDARDLVHRADALFA